MMKRNRISFEMRDVGDVQPWEMGCFVCRFELIIGDFQKREDHTICKLPFLGCIRLSFLLTHGGEIHRDSLPQLQKSHISPTHKPLCDLFFKLCICNFD